MKRLSSKRMIKERRKRKKKGRERSKMGVGVRKKGEGKKDIRIIREKGRKKGKDKIHGSSWSVTT